MADIVIAGGCFWGVEEYFKRLKGIENTVVGYINGTKENLTYEEVCSNQYLAYEGVALTYNPAIISLEKILDHLFRIIDPTSLDKQGNDVGVSYRVGAYYTNEQDKKIISEFVEKKQQEYINPIVFEVAELIHFSLAEQYHQAYLEKNPQGYCHVDFSQAKPTELK